MRLLKAIGLVVLIWGAVFVICGCILLLYAWGASHYGWWFPPAVAGGFVFCGAVWWAYGQIE